MRTPGGRRNQWSNIKQEGKKNLGLGIREVHCNSLEVEGQGTEEWGSVG